MKESFPTEEYIGQEGDTVGKDVHRPEISRRDFLRNLAFTVGSFVASEKSESHAQSPIEQKKVQEGIAINIELPKSGERVVLTDTDIEKKAHRFEKTREFTERNMNRGIEQFDPKIQEQIMHHLGTMIKPAMLEIVKRGFSFGINDSYHMHMLVNQEELARTVAEVAGVDLEKLNLLERSDLSRTITHDPEKVSAFLPLVKALVIHCAELPTKEQMKDTKYWVHREERNIVVDEGGVRNIYPDFKNHPNTESTFKESALSEGSHFPSQGVLASDYNRNSQTDYVMTDEQSVGLMQIRFFKDEKRGVEIDPEIPKIAFMF